MRLLNYKGRAIASVVAFLVSAFASTVPLVKAKGTCVPHPTPSGLESLVCSGATFGDLGYVDYLIMAAAGLAAVAFVWFAAEKLAPRVHGLLSAPLPGWLVTAILAGFLVAVGAVWYSLMNEASAQTPPDDGKLKESTVNTEVDPRVLAQAPLTDAARKIQNLWWENKLQNFTGVALDNERRVVVLYWKGPLPPEMAELVEELRAGVLIEVVDRPYSLSEIDQEARRIMGLNAAGLGFRITEAGPLPDFSALRIGVESSDQLDRARQAIQSPVRIEFHVAPRLRLFSNRSSVSPLLPRYADYLIIAAAGLVAVASVWYVAGKLRQSRGNKA